MKPPTAIRLSPPPDRTRPVRKTEAAASVAEEKEPEPVTAGAAPEDWANLVAEVHKNTGIRIDTADPVLAVAVLNHRVFAAFREDLRETILTASIQLTAAGTANEAAAKKLASDVINSAAAYLAEAHKTAAREAVAEMRAELQREAADAAALVAASHSTAPRYPVPVWLMATVAGAACVASAFIGYAAAGF